jgi:hypothetical protein
MLRFASQTCHVKVIASAWNHVSIQSKDKNHDSRLEELIEFMSHSSQALHVSLFNPRIEFVSESLRVLAHRVQSLEITEQNADEDLILESELEMKQLESLRCDRVIFLPRPQLIPSLRALSLRGIDFKFGTEEIGRRQEIGQYTINRLEFDDCSGWMFCFQTTFFDLSQLEYLHLGHSRVADFQFLSQIKDTLVTLSLTVYTSNTPEFFSLPRIRVLDFSSCFWVSDDFLVKTLKISRSLKHLRLSDCRNISDEGLARLLFLDGLILEALDVSRCKQLKGTGWMSRLKPGFVVNVEGTQILDKSCLSTEETL